MNEHVLFVEVPSVAASFVPAGGGQFIEQGGRITGLVYRCACKCGGLQSLLFAPGQWAISGPREKPTVTPGFQSRTGCLWVGQLIDGEFRQII